MYTKKNMGKAIRYLRINILTTSQVQLSKKIGIAQPTLSKIERGVASLDAIDLYNLLYIYNISDEVFKKLLDSKL